MSVWTIGDLKIEKFFFKYKFRPKIYLKLEFFYFKIANCLNGQYYYRICTVVHFYFLGWNPMALSIRKVFGGPYSLYYGLIWPFETRFEILRVLATRRHWKIQNRTKTARLRAQNVKQVQNSFGRIWLKASLIKLFLMKTSRFM